MATLKRTICGVLACAALVFTAPAIAADTGGDHTHAQDHHHEIQISDAWARPTIGQAPNSAAYFTIVNHGPNDDRLHAVSCSCAAKAELHQTRMKDNVMHMEAIDGGLPLPVDQSVSFAPGAKHVMLMGVTAPLTEGQTISLILSFDLAGEQTIQVPVRKAAANADADPHAGMDHGAHQH